MCKSTLYLTFIYLLTYQPYITNLGKVTYYLIFIYTFILFLPLPKLYLIYNFKLI